MQKMCSTLSAEDRAFRDEVILFLERELPAEMRFKFHLLENSTEAATRWWHQTLSARGWAAPGWPKEYGGTDWSNTRRYIFNWELAQVGAPRLSEFGIALVGPVIIKFGSEQQKKQHLPGILDGTVLWCQGYSEPGAGSDLAALRTNAVRQNDHYIINGQKIWTTHAHWADWIFCLARTNMEVKPQAGISFFLIDMKSKGIVVRPIGTIDGSHHLNEVYFTDVKVPAENIVGTENSGWSYAKFLLDNERAGVAATAQSRIALNEIRSLLQQTRASQGDLLGTDEIEQKIASLDIRLLALETLEQRVLAARLDAREVDHLRMPLKLLGSTLQQDISELRLALGDYASLPAFGSDFERGPPGSQVYSSGTSATRSYLYQRASTIYGGTSEIQKNLMAKLILGL